MIGIIANGILTIQPGTSKILGHVLLHALAKTVRIVPVPARIEPTLPMPERVIVHPMHEVVQ